MRLTIPKICELFWQKGHNSYDGEVVSQLEHALQCATLAESANSSSETIAACLLHDLGHLMHDFGKDAAERGIDDRHEYRAIPYLRLLFSPAVTEPIRLHVQAKRYLCCVDSHYWEALSEASKLSLEIQGGQFSTQEAEAFIAQPYAQEAVQLRLWDDGSKVVGKPTASFTHFVHSMEVAQKDSDFRVTNWYWTLH